MEMELKPTQAAPDPGRQHRPHAIDPGRRATISGFFFFFFSDEHGGVALVVFFLFSF